MVSRLCENYLIRKFSNLVIESNHKNNLYSILIEKWEHSKSKNDLFPISRHQEQVLFVPAVANLEFQRIHGFQDPIYLRNTAVSSNEILIFNFPRHHTFHVLRFMLKKNKNHILLGQKKKKKNSFPSYCFFCVFLQQNENKIPKADNSVEFMSKKKSSYAISYSFYDTDK